MSEPVEFLDRQDPAMRQAFQAARASFRFFWRELSWERRRILPALGASAVKLPFSDGPREDGNPEFEHMWIEDVDFDGDTLSGTLLNEPNWITSVKLGDPVRMPFGCLMDWMMTSGNHAYGGFTVNVLRSWMDAAERAEYDRVWGLEFGDPSEVRIEIFNSPKPKQGLLARWLGEEAELPADGGEFKDHPMCVNVLRKMESRIKKNRGFASAIDEYGWSQLHREAMAGNLGMVKLLIAYGADVAVRTPGGYTAAELARKIGWPEVADAIENSV